MCFVLRDLSHVRTERPLPSASQKVRPQPPLAWKLQPATYVGLAAQLQVDVGSFSHDAERLGAWTTSQIPSYLLPTDLDAASSRTAIHGVEFERMLWSLP